jgi:tetratricopeptide (TPR) repeat protein
LRHHGAVLYAAFSADGWLVVTASADRTARVWDAATGEPVTPPLLHHGPVAHAAFSPDGTRLATAGARGARLWRLPRVSLPVADLEQPAELLAVARLDDAGNLVHLDAGEMRVAWHEVCARHPGLFHLPTEPEEMAWHRREVEEAEASGDQFGAAWHLDYLLAVAPDDVRLCLRHGDALAGLGEWQRALDDYSRAVALVPEAWEARLRRGRAHAELGHWERAIADFACNRDLGTDDPHVWYLQALACRANGDLPAYWARCAELLERFGQARNAEEVRVAVWSAVLLPDAVADPARLVALAERGFHAGPSRAAYRLTLGAAQYRAGRYLQAVQTLEQALRTDAGEVALPARLFLAMACHWLDQGEAAQRWFDEAMRLARERPPDGWDRRLEVEWLRAEAEKVLTLPGKQTGWRLEKSRTTREKHTRHHSTPARP